MLTIFSRLFNKHNCNNGEYNKVKCTDNIKIRKHISYSGKRPYILLHICTGGKPSIVFVDIMRRIKPKLKIVFKMMWKYVNYFGCLMQIGCICIVVKKKYLAEKKNVAILLKNL